MINNNNTDEQLSDHCSIEEENHLELLDDLDEKLLNNFSDKLLVDPFKSSSDIENGLRIKRKSPPPGIDQPSIIPAKNLVPIRDTDTPTTIKARIDKSHSKKRVLEMIERQIYTNLVGKMQQNIDRLDEKIDDDDDDDFEKVPRKIFSMTDSQIDQLSNLPSLVLNHQKSLNFNPIAPSEYQKCSKYGNKTASLCTLDSKPFNMPLIQSKFNSNANIEANNSNNIGMNNNLSILKNNPLHLNNGKSNNVLDLYQINKDMQSYQNFSSVLGNFLKKRFSKSNLKRMQ